MQLEFLPGGVIKVDGAVKREIIYKNFRGEGSKYNREGDRNFALRINDREIADALVREGWNVRIKPPREDYPDDEFMYLPIKIKMNERGPNIYLVSGSRQTKLDEETISCLDDIDILSVDLDIRPYDWEVNGKTGRTAYLRGMRVFQDVDRFTEDYERHQGTIHQVYDE